MIFLKLSSYLLYELHEMMKPLGDFKFRIHVLFKDVPFLIGEGGIETIFLSIQNLNGK